MESVIGRLNIALAFFFVVAINQIFPHQRIQIILICAAKLAIFQINQSLCIKDLMLQKNSGGLKKFQKKFALYLKNTVHLQLQISNAEIAQLVEHDLAKVGVASSSLVFRSELNPETFRDFL